MLDFSTSTFVNKKIICKNYTRTEALLNDSAVLRKGLMFIDFFPIAPATKGNTFQRAAISCLLFHTASLLLINTMCQVNTVMLHIKMLLHTFCHLSWILKFSWVYNFSTFLPRLSFKKIAARRIVKPQCSFLYFKNKSEKILNFGKQL